MISFKDIWKQRETERERNYTVKKVYFKIRNSILVLLLIQGTACHFLVVVCKMYKRFLSENFFSANVCLILDQFVSAVGKTPETHYNYPNQWLKV